MNNEQLTQTSDTNAVNSSGPEFEQLKAQVQATFDARMEQYGPALFVTKSKGLSTVYRKAFPEAEQQHHNCSSCRHFFERFGHMVFVTPEGGLVSAIWDPSTAPEEYKASVAAIEAHVLRSGISNRFYTEHQQWGTGETSGWTHYELRPIDDRIVSQYQLARYEGDARTSFDLLLSATQKFTPLVVSTAINQVKSQGKLLERFLPQLEWLYGFLKTLEDKSIGAARNLVYRESASVGFPFSRIVNNVEGNLLLTDIAGGRHPEAALRTFITKVDPEFYRQKVAAPTDGNVQVAQKIFAELGLGADDMARRMAGIDEIRYSWKPPVAAEAVAKETPLFGDLATKQSAEKPKVTETVADGGKITWEKFKQKVLPDVLAIQAFVLPAEKYVYFSTAQKPDAGRLFWYDKEEERNTFAWHTTNDPLPCRYMGLTQNQLVDVVGIAIPPACWTGGDHANKYLLDVLMVNGLRDSREGVGSALFAELMRPELYEAERVLKAYSEKTTMDCSGENQAIGFGTNYARKLRVRTEHGLTDYLVDRLE